MNPLIKWPGGKSREIDKIRHLIPAHDRYIEPFFGGGALFFHLAPQAAAINDISQSLMQYYRLIKDQDKQLYDLLMDYDRSFQNLVRLCERENDALLRLFFQLHDGAISEKALGAELTAFLSGISRELHNGFTESLLLDAGSFDSFLLKMAEDKFLRTVANHNKKPYPTEDLRENLVTGFTSGYYMYFRQVYNDISLGRVTGLSEAYVAANFYFIREYCYGSMFRYNAKGEFNIPYGGMSYNRKDLQAKISHMFSRETQQLFANTDIHCSDFETFFHDIQLTDRDFLFLDPPYDTDFSDYEGKAFTKGDQARLAQVLRTVPAKFILVIKNTGFIHSLYEQDFHILRFDKQYSYNVRSRNDRDAEHLIITNFPV